jgi:hypothetical protein
MEGAEGRVGRISECDGWNGERGSNSVRIAAIPASVPPSRDWDLGRRQTGMYGPPLRRKQKSERDRLVCANVYGLCWSSSLLARMECAALFSPLVIQS